MKLDFGRVQSFKEKGFGFLESHFHNDNVFFHISQVSCRKTRQQLNQFVENEMEAEQKPLFFFYEYIMESKGPKVKKIWLEQNPPAWDWECWQDRLLETLKKATAFDQRLTSCFRVLSPSRSESLLELPVFVDNPAHTLNSLDAEGKDVFRRLVNIESRLLDPSCTLTTSLQNAAAVMLGEEATLNIIRQRYLNDPKGIRNDSFMRYLCLGCGSENVEHKSYRGIEGKQLCLDCGANWYVNHCWREGHCRARVDSRDPETPKCPVCGWSSCSCGACNLHGCQNSRYSREFPGGRPVEASPMTPVVNQFQPEVPAYFAEIPPHPGNEPETARKKEQAPAKHWPDTTSSGIPVTPGMGVYLGDGVYIDPDDCWF